MTPFFDWFYEKGLDLESQLQLFYFEMVNMSRDLTSKTGALWNTLER
jgi:hypothetical protein